ncbi:MAG TPA: hypothetical protein VK563_00290 [Puia sp.]|nr:hypothetical protein [Puia sp.]
MQLHSRHSIALPFIFIFMIYSCKKDAHPPTDPPGPPAPKVKTIIAGNDIRTYTYDSKGRVSQIVLDHYGRYDYAYTDTSVGISFYDTTQVFTGKEVYKLNTKGLATSSSNTYLTSDLNLYTYTSAGQLLTFTTIRTLSNQPAIRWDYTYFYTNNNLDSVKFSLDDGSSVTTGAKYYYDAYFTDVTNTLGNVNYGQAFLGLSSKNPVKLARDIGHDNTGDYPQTSYNYEYDTQNRITKSQEIWGTSSFTPVAYTWY